ncbi:hypothetical protein BDV96DRAFT_590536 [Lophiotrema nucula]|uniref:RNase III domain-containing protein n=1 Tax=Lophiotrema nucula TaxID=690887 RepID=A0A6A5YHV8_9PLEO|nr:hypothetical protein BDV96DRAFT_590536 [Lophiotrema nucula]
MTSNTDDAPLCLPSTEIKMITDDEADIKLAEAERILNYTFTNKAHGIEALLIAPGVPFNTLVRLESGDSVYRIETNAALAKIGDKALDLILLRLFEPTCMCKGFFDNNIRQKLATNHNLHCIGTKLGLNECLSKHPPDAIYGKAVADAVEALIGAIVLETGIDDAERAVFTMGIVADDMIAEGKLCDIDTPSPTLSRNAKYFKNMINSQKSDLIRLIGEFRVRRATTG